MAQFIKVGNRYINMDLVELVEPCAGGELRVNFNEGGISLGGVEAEDMARWLARNAQVVTPAIRAARPLLTGSGPCALCGEWMWIDDNHLCQLCRGDRPVDPPDDPDARMEHYFTEATAAELKAPVWHPE